MYMHIIHAKCICIHIQVTAPFSPNIVLSEIVEVLASDKRSFSVQESLSQGAKPACQGAQSAQGKEPALQNVDTQHAPSNDKLPIQSTPENSIHMQEIEKPHEDTTTSLFLVPDEDIGNKPSDFASDVSQGGLVCIHSLQSETSKQYNGRIGLVSRIVDGKVELKLVPDSKELKISEAKVCSIIPQEAQAAILEKLEQFQKAERLEQFQKAERQGNQGDLANLSLQIGGIYKSMELFEEALKFYERSLRLELMEVNPAFKVSECTLCSCL
jgi:hypothetical protein